MNDLDTLVKIRTSIEQGNLEDVASLIGDDKSRRDMKTAFGSWLHVASSNGQLRIVQWLLNTGLDINNRSGLAKGTALCEAADAGNADIVRLLLDEGAELDVSEPEGNPLFAAIQEGSLEIVQMLLEHGIDASIKYSGQNMTDMDAYAFAMEQGQREIAEHIQQWLKLR
jgi:ankyrin repeat protein